MERTPPDIGKKFVSAAMPAENQLLHAILAGDIWWAKKALENDFELNTPRFIGKSFLRHAGEKCDHRMCELLVANGSDLNETNGKHRYSLLHHAAASGNYGFASILLSLGARPSTCNSYKATPLHLASNIGQEYLAALLLEHDADINASDHRDMTPLQYAIRRGQTGMAKFLIRRSCRVKREDIQDAPESLRLIAENSLLPNGP